MPNTVSLRRRDGALVETMIYPVLHLTDASVGVRPVVLGRHDFFSHEEAILFAQEQSKTQPAPQRFAVYTPYNVWVGSWQCGKCLAAFQATA